MFKQLKQTVASAISSDPMYAYTVDTAAPTLCGRGYMFEKCDAVVRANNKKVSIFTLHTKRLLERCAPDEALAMIATVKSSVALLTHVRHPGVLSIEGPVVEEKKKIWFVTERVSAVLAFENVHDMPLQVKLLGLCHCAEAIRFLQEKAELLLTNFALSSVYVVEDGRWKVGDLCFAVPRAQLGTVAPPQFPFRSVAAPLLDYTPPEYVEFCFRQSSGGGSGLFPSGSAPLVFPDSDTFCFLVVTAEVLTEKRLFNCAGNAREQPRQLAAAEAVLSRYFPPGALRLPRPPIATVVETGPFATPDMKTLTALAVFDTLESETRFRVLKGLYDGLTQSTFCEAVVLSSVVPLMVRESRVDAMLRFVLPILLLCANAVSGDNFDRALREYFVSLLAAIIRAPSMERTAVYAEQVTQKRDGLSKHFTSVEDKATLIVPFILKLMQCDGNERLQKGSLEWLRDVLAQTPTVKLNLPSDIAARLLRVAASSAEFFAIAFQCLEKLLGFATTETRMEVEASLARSISGTAASYTAMQVDYMLRLLKDIQDNMAPEHRATRSIPLLCPLLLHTNATVRQFAVTSVVAYAQAFAGVSSGVAPPPAPVPADPFAPFTPHSAAPPVAYGPPAHTPAAAPPAPGAPPARRTNDDVFASLFA